MKKVTLWAEIKRIAVCVMVMVGMMSAGLAGGSNLQKIFNDAKASYEAGNYEKAALGFRTVLKYKPGYVYARKYLAQTEEMLKKGTTSSVTMESKLASLRIPSVAFEDASLGTVMAFLSQKAEEVSAGKVVANFIYKGPSDDKESKTVTLKLSNVPMTEVIRYVGQLTGTKFKYEEYAVVGIPSATVEREEAALKAVAEERAAALAKPKFDDKPKDPFAK